MEETKVISQEKLSISPPQLKLDISERGEIKIDGSVEPGELQNILDSSFLRQKIYLHHQEKLSKENNQTSIYIGAYFSLIISLVVFISFNLKPQPQTKTGFIDHAKQTIS